MPQTSVNSRDACLGAFRGMSLALILKDLLKRIPSEGTNRRKRDILYQHLQSNILWTQQRNTHTSDSLLKFASSKPCAQQSARPRRPRAKHLAQGSIPSSTIRLDDNNAQPTYPTVVQQARNNINKFENCVVLTRVGSFYEVRDYKCLIRSFLTLSSYTLSKLSNMRRRYTSSLRRKKLWQDQSVW